MLERSAKGSSARWPLVAQVSSAARATCLELQEAAGPASGTAAAAADSQAQAALPKISVSTSANANANAQGIQYSTYSYEYYTRIRVVAPPCVF